MVSHVVVDGSNLATEGRKVPSLAQLRDAVAEFRVAIAPYDVTQGGFTGGGTQSMSVAVDVEPLANAPTPHRRGR